MNTDPVRVLLISDDPEEVLQVRRALAKAPGVKLMRTPASLLSDGLRRLAAPNVGLVLLDLNLPDRGGLDALKSIQEAFPEIPVLVLGGLSGSTVPLDLLKLGAQDYIAKDEFSGPMLTRAVRYAIERKQAESALRGGAELFRSVYQEAPIGIVLTSREGKFITANPAFCRMLGYTVEEISSMTFLDLTHPGDRSGNRHGVEDMWQGKLAHYRTDKRYIAKNGDTRWGSLSTSLIRDGDGTPIYALAMVEDITERKQAEELLREGEERYKLMFDSAPLAINITRGTEITYANPSYLKMFGFSDLDELKSRAALELFAPEARPQILENIQRRAEGLPVPDSYETECLRKDGTKFPALLHLTRTTFADGPATVAFVMDVTERTRAEAALRQSEEKFRLLSERSQVGIYIIQDAKLAYVNPAFAEMFGYAAEEIMSMPSPQDLLRPADVEKVRTRLQEELLGDDGGRLTAFRGTRKDGSIVEIEARGALIDYGGHPAVLGTAMDVTDRKQAQALQEAVYRIGSATLTTGSLSDLYAEIHRAISGVMNAENFYIAVYDEERDLLTFPYFRDTADEMYEDEIHPEKGLTAYVLRTGESLLCTQAVHDELEQRGEVKLLGTPSSIWLGVPLSIQGKTIGAIVVQHYSDPAAYGERERHMLEFVSAQVAVAIERKRAEEAVRRRADELAALNATVLEITTPHDLNALLQTIVERAAQLLGTGSGGMYLCDPVRREVRCVVSYNTAQDFTGTILKYGEGAAGTVAQTGEPLMIDNYRVWSQRAASYEERQPFTAVLSAPMFWNNQVIGVLHVLHDVEGRHFTQADLALLTQFASHAAIAVENTRLYEEAQREITDRRVVEAHLRNSETALEGILESVADGILAVSSENKVLHANARFVEMWRIPQSIMSTQDDAVLLQHVVQQLNDPQAFLGKVQELYKSTEESFDTLTFKDGRVFERRSRPLMREAEPVGRVWSFHDITERRQAQTLQEAVYQIAAAAESTGSLDDLYQEIHRIVASVMPAENFYITIYDAVHDLLRFPYFRDLHDELFIEGVQPARGLTAYVLRTGKSLLCTQAVHDELERRGEVKLLGSPSAIWLGVPLIVEGNTIGAMVVQHYFDPAAYGEREQHMLEFVSAQVAVAIERKRVQESLKESEARFRALFEDSPISLWEEDFSLVKQRLDALRQDGIANFEEYLEAHPEVVGECAARVRVLDANKATLAIYGAKRKEDLPRGLAAVLEGSAPEDFRDELVKIAAGEIRFHWEGVNRTLDGRLIDVDLNWSAVRGYEKTLSRVIISAIDITERKQAEKLQDAIYRIAQAADQAESLDALYPAIHAIIRETMVADNFYIALYDEESDILSFPYFVDAMEPSAPSTKPGKGLTEYVLRTGNSLLCDEARFEELMQSGQVEPVGAASPIWLGVPLVVDGKVLGVIAVQDYQNARAYGPREQQVLEFVSSQAAKAIQRKRAEQALSRAEEKYHSIFENATEAITQTTPAGRYLAANPAAARMLGYESPEDLILGVTDLTGQFYVQPGRRQEFTNLMEEHGSISGFESEVYRGDGGTLWISEDSHVVRGEDGRILYYEGTAQDITERKRAEQALRQRARELQTLYETSLEVSAQTSLDTLLRAIVERAASLVGTDGGGLYLMESDGQSLTLQVGHNLPRAHVGTRLRLGEGVSGAVAQSGKPMQVEDYQTWPGRAKAYEDASFRRVLAVPLKVKDRIIGVINVTDFRQPGSFSEDQIRLANLFADQAALAVEAARLYHEERSRSGELATLYESATAMSSNLALDVVLKTVVEQVTNALKTDEVAVSFVDNARDAVVTMVDYAPTAPEALNVAGTTYLLRDYPTTRRVLESRQPLLLSRNGRGSDTAETTLLKKTGMGTLLLLPLVARGQVSGLMEMYWRDKLRVTTKDELHLAQSLSAQVAVYLENSRLFERSERRLARTLALHRIDQAVTGSTDVSLILQVILDQALPQLGAAAAAILLYDPITQGLNYASGAGFRTEALRHTQLAMGQGYAGRAAMSRQMVHIPDLRTRNTDFLRSPSFSQEGFISYTAVPLIAKGEIKGVLEVFHRTPLEPDSEWQSFLETLAGQAATAVDSATMFEDLQRANDQLTLAYDATIEGWSRAMDLRDRETEGHSQRVAEMTVKLARLLGLPDQNLIHVRRGALLHDIGKMGVPDEILQKVGPLTVEDWVVMKRHPVMAYEMLAHIRYLEPALEIPYCHHEKWDGTGYPRGLEGDRIPLAARVFAVVDVYDALTADRPYRPAWTPEQAMDYIRSQSGKHFEPAVAEAFLGMTVLQT